MTNTTKKVLIYGSLTIALVGIYFLATAKPKPKPEPEPKSDPEEECKKKGKGYKLNKKGECKKVVATFEFGESSDVTFCKKYKVDKDVFLVKDPFAFGLSLQGINVKTTSQPTEKLSAGTIISAKGYSSEINKNTSRTQWMELCDEKTGASLGNGYVTLSSLSLVK